MSCRRNIPPMVLETTGPQHFAARQRMEAGARICVMNPIIIKKENTFWKDFLMYGKIPELLIH